VIASKFLLHFGLTVHGKFCEKEKDFDRGT